MKLTVTNCLNPSLSTTRKGSMSVQIIVIMASSSAAFRCAGTELDPAVKADVIFGWLARPFSCCVYSRSCFLFRCRIKLDETPTAACIVSEQSLQRAACFFSSRVMSKNCFQWAMFTTCCAAVRRSQSAAASYESSFYFQ